MQFLPIEECRINVLLWIMFNSITDNTILYFRKEEQKYGEVQESNIERDYDAYVCTPSGGLTKKVLLNAFPG